MSTPTLVYDADCGFCTRCADFARARGAFEVAPWQALDLPAVGLTEQQVSEAAYWLDGDTTRRGNRAIAAALRAFRPGVRYAGYRLLGRLIDLPPVRPVAALGYALVARYRYRYRLPGGTAACRVPPAA
ncbi:DCC1-like thiol-disulfide oxidoreductase family protein [Nocardioides sp.]|uniref:thiol-disulfide oxidoreductase DCC family protein n=1 Tax=Nocardioides sp. TaxID=35761 RepID=UPI00286AF5E6|nr:DCC1-like thiol-disulfide oxidoreductase family protein [Nocardioides sp.]